MVLMKETLSVELNEKEKKVIVNRVIVDEMGPEEFLANHGNVLEAIKKMGDDLSKVDLQALKIKQELEKGIKEHSVRLEGLDKALSKARLWAEVNKKLNERRGGQKDEENRQPGQPPKSG